jgi:serine/threonine protein kinase
LGRTDLTGATSTPRNEDMEKGMATVEYALVDRDFYAPLEPSPGEAGYTPSRPPAGWVRHDEGMWTHWTPPDEPIAAQGWKVHVSARLARTQYVLDMVADVCAEYRVAFKHLRTEWLFLWLHHKHGPRSQSGKFCAAYPTDSAAALALMRALEAALADESGPFVLTDRRFGASKVVSYRYGAFRPRYRLRPDGTEIIDQRQPRFQLPPGITDPFGATAEEIRTEPVSLHGYTFRAVLQYSNAGGAYRASAPDGRIVFVKEARADNGYHWDRSTAVERLRREHDVLRALHAAVPGVAPEPLEHFRHWEHEFLVTEFVPGRSLWSWMVKHSPLPTADRSAVTYTEYHDRCRALLRALRDQLDRLHAAGYVFVDLNPRNVLVDDDDRPRLVDFEVAGRVDEPLRGHGAEGYYPPEATADPTCYDEYALAAITQTLLHPLHAVLDRNPAAAAHLRADLPVVPDDLWRAATRFRPAPDTSSLPDPAAVAADPARWLAWLRDRVADGLDAVARPSARMPYPVVPEGHVTNPYGVAHGIAGVVYALHRAGRPVDERIVTGLVTGAVRERDDLPPGLFSGAAGVAWVLAELGRLDAARDLLATADRHPIISHDATLAHGSAGVALAHLALHRHYADDRHLTRAADLLGALPAGDALTAGLGPDATTGWRVGRPGVALALHYLARATGDESARRRGRELLMDDLVQSHDPGDGGLLFRVSRRDRRVEPYLACGSAGFAFVAGRYLTPRASTMDPLADAYRRCLTSVRAALLPMLPALFEGLAGLGLALSDLGLRTGDDSLHAAAVRSARALFKYTVPRGPAVHFLGGIGNRISADLAYGSAGVLLFLDQLLNRRADSLFTLDLVRRSTP